MSDLIDYIQKHVDRGECQCGNCVDVNPNAEPIKGHTVDLTFFKMAARNSPNAETLRELINQHKPVFTENLDLFDGKEHSYIELGGWIGDQGQAIMLIGLGKILGLWSALTPDTIMPFLPKEMKMTMAGRGMVSLQVSQNTLVI